MSQVTFLGAALAHAQPTCNYHYGSVTRIPLPRYVCVRVGVCEYVCVCKRALLQYDIGLFCNMIGLFCHYGSVTRTPLSRYAHVCVRAA